MTDPSAPAGPRFAEFVALVAAMMALGALGIDTVLPALPAIGGRLGAADPRDWPLLVTVFLAGFGVAQLVHGALSDRFGRRPVLLAALAVYVVANLLAAAAGSFVFLLIVRFAGGIAVAATRVVAIALIRDLYSGRAMARVSSLVFMVFMAVPVMAPALGQGILLLGSWRLIFLLSAAVTLLVAGWFATRMPETLRPEDRVPLSARRLLANWRRALTDRFSLGYTLAATALQGALFGYLGSIQPIVDRVFGRPQLLALVFAGSAAAMAAANLLNSRIVMRVGTRRISQIATLAMVAASGAALATAGGGHETLVGFAILQALTMAGFGLATSNFSAMAMENMGAIAGTAASVQGFVGMTGGALLGTVVGRAFDGTTVPLHLSFLLSGLVAFAIVAVAERGRMFRPS